MQLTQKKTKVFYIREGLLASNSHEKDYMQQLAFFERRLYRRGYEPRRVRAILSKYPHWRRTEILRKTKKKSKQAKKVLVCTDYFKGFESLSLSSALVRAKILARSKFDSSLDLGTRVGINLFRRLYRHTWKPTLAW